MAGNSDVMSLSIGSGALLEEYGWVGESVVVPCGGNIRAGRKYEEDVTLTQVRWQLDRFAEDVLRIAGRPCYDVVPCPVRTGLGRDNLIPDACVDPIEPLIDAGVHVNPSLVAPLHHIKYAANHHACIGSDKRAWLGIKQ